MNDETTTVCDECGNELDIVDLNTCGGCHIEACADCVAQHVCEQREMREDDNDE